MNKINLLDDELINKISAGEVVERPASIVKELVENSIDAGSNNITVEIMDGGIPYIKVSDDGCGMDEIDAVLAFGRHATSKIKSINDLFNIETLGFRGEALASIASISKVLLKTKEENSLYGTLINVEGGKIIKKVKCGCPKGCSIEVRDIFYNTPARRKFLKRPSTEAMYITDMVAKIALSRPDISFKYIKDKKIELQTSGNNSVRDVILRLYGDELYSSLVQSEYTNEYLNVKVFLCKPSYTKGNRNMQILFVNGRFVKNKVYNVAIEEAYKTLIPINRYPVVITYINIDPRKIDVNVHPTKLEVKFSDEKEIFDSIYNTIKNALNKSNLIPVVKYEKKFTFSDADKDYKHEQTQINQFERTTKEITNHSGDVPFIKDETIYSSNGSNQNIYFNNDKISETVQDKYISNFNSLPDDNDDKYKLIGVLFSTFIIVEKDDMVYLIDQHAAHERILYERFMSKYNNVQGKQTTIPILVNIEPGDEEIINENVELFNKLGYKFESFGNNSIILREVPVILGQPESRQLFIDIIDKLRNGDFNKDIKLKEESIIMMACKKAVKAMDKLSKEEIKSLFDELKITENPYTCPHGRPVIISIKKYEIEKMFKRIM
ncbi:DNA mismatch repair protein MutL [Thermoanaerobacterium thermosaccharolyticum]|uniref:DNA mismatch repair protein MutL n=1 Tax=Thermoanaerobacterium thermosaccharolyticum TaxID=1517 RepID=A0A223I3J5_THETR|nr:DNA mismatch repair endonuclease MutL [Thermoanaerobacterium thermosaccharolyticum]AST59075.1 DNA mismatch repair protein [Thermoanaerobacterium thermosaccharolyticum]PHO07686.1 DNA mismatch repair protein MutL [Thermoanaerobacterium thermosaccharolyticum]